MGAAYCLLILAVLCAQGTNNLGYYLSLVLTLITSLFAPHIAIEWYRSWETDSPSLSAMLKPLWLGAVMVFVLVPTLVALNPLSSPTCDWWEGLAFLFLGPVISALGFSGVGLYLHRQHLRAHVAAAGLSGC